MKIVNKEMKLCFILNIGPHYRFPIFNAIAEKFTCAFYIGNHLKQPIKTFDYKALKGYVATLNNHFLRNFYWQSKSLRLVFKNMICILWMVSLIVCHHGLYFFYAEYWASRL